MKKAGIYIAIAIFLIIGTHGCKKKENPFAGVAGKWQCVEYRHKIRPGPLYFYEEWRMQGTKLLYVDSAIQGTTYVLRDFKSDIQATVIGNRLNLIEIYTATDNNGVEEKFHYGHDIELILGQATYGDLSFDSQGKKIWISNSKYGSSGSWSYKRSLIKLD